MAGVTGDSFGMVLAIPNVAISLVVEVEPSAGPAFPLVLPWCGTITGFAGAFAFVPAALHGCC